MASQTNMDPWITKCLELEKQITELSKKKSCSCTTNHNEEEISSGTISAIREQLATVKEAFIQQQEKNMERHLSLAEEIAVDRQYQRRNSIILHGYFELPKCSSNYDFITITARELNILFPSFGGFIHPMHIDAAHPLATKKRSSTNHLVVVKFKNRWLKKEIIRRYEGQKLANPGISVTEHLTEYTRELKSSAIRLVGAKNVHMEDCVVYAEVNGFQYTIQYSKDLALLKELIDNPPSPQNQETPANETSSTSNAEAVPNSSPPPVLSGSNRVALGVRKPVNAVSTNSAPNTSKLPVACHYEEHYPALFQTLYLNDPRSSTKTSLQGRPVRARSNSNQPPRKPNSTLLLSAGSSVATR